MVRMEIDINGEIPMGEFLEGLEAHQGKIESFIAKGFGGGNPCLILVFPAMDNAQAFGLEMMGEDEIDHYIMGA